MNFFCIADEDTVRGFRLAGVPGRAVANPKQAADALVQAIGLPEVGILIVTQEVAAGLREQVDALRLNRDRPLIVEIPGPHGPMEKRQTLRQLVHSAVGISVDSPKEQP